MRPTIAHATDLTGDDEAAFHHAAALAVASESRLVSVHGTTGAVDAGRWPDAAALAARWGRPFVHERVAHACCDEVADTVVDAIRRLEPDLVVTGTHGRHGLAALLEGSVAEAVARNLGVPTLIVPNHVRGFVDPRTGGIDLQRVLVAAGDGPEAEAGLAAAGALVALAGVRAEIEPLTVRGSIPDALVVAARTRHACVIVMATHGHDGIVDALRGSKTEHVIRDAGCPVLSVPMPR